jgi:hypothetical protein
MLHQSQSFAQRKEQEIYLMEQYNSIMDQFEAGTK